MLMVILVPTAILVVMGGVFGVGLAAASKAFAVKQDERVGKVREVLPGANCGACGFSGCDGYAGAVVAGDAAPNKCTVGGQAVAEQVAAVMGVAAGSVEKRVARVRCAGTYDNSKAKYIYDGIQDCGAAKLVHDGPSSCAFSCAGFGNCARACKFGAIYVDNGLAYVIESRCTACGQCAEACPKGLIALVPADSSYTVRCMNKDKGAVVRKNCAVGCIGCMRCVKACKSDAVKVTNNLASIDPAKCTKCGECYHACPSKCINYYECVLADPAAKAS